MKTKNFTAAVCSCN